MEGVLDWEESFNICKKSVSLSARAKKKKVEWIALAFHSHSVFVTTKVGKSNFYKDLDGLVEWRDTVEKRVNGKKNDKTTFCMILLQ